MCEREKYIEKEKTKKKNIISRLSSFSSIERENESEKARTRERERKKPDDFVRWTICNLLQRIFLLNVLSV